MRAGSVDLFRELAASPDPQVRQEAVAALAAADGGLPALETLWPSLDPTLRRTAVDQLAGSRTRAQAFVDAVQAGRIARDVVDAAARDKLRAALGHDPFAEPGAPVVLRLSGGEEDAVDAAIDLDGPFTVETWIRLADGITNADGILCRRGGPDFNFHDARFRVWDGRSDRIIAQRPVTAGAWTHVAVTRDEKGDLRIYLDGEPDPAKGALPGPLRGLSIGLTNAAGGTAAELAEYRVWSVERTAGQVREHYNRSLAAQPGLAFHVPFGAAWARLKGRAENAAPSEPPPLLTEAELRKLERARALYDGPGDAAAGKAVFARTCLNCHTLRSEGGSIGPNLDGVGLREPSSLLAAIVTPSAAVESGYRLFRLRTNDGDVLDGLLVRESPQELVLRPVNGEERTIPRSRIQQSGFTRFSIMPEGLLDALSPKDAADLFAHLKAAGRPLDLVDATPETLATFFNGKDLSGWDGNTSLWRVEGGEIVGRTAGLKRNEFLRSRLVLGDFRLSLQVRMPLQNRGFENSGIQFRSKALPDGEMQGYQADIGPGWWGKLYEEHGRGLLWDQSGEAHVRANEWNAYEIVASGSRIRTSINGRPCVDLDDPKGARRGQIAFQLHSGGPTEIRFKDLKLELAP
jgi:putative heme-binding domain-containing protein